MPKVSIIVTSFNIEKYIAQCLESIVNQTLEDIEIIVVDDGSSDSTPDIIRSYAAKDGRIKPILLEKNTVGGVATPANHGLEAATGRYIGFADGDDYCELDMFEKLFLAADADDHDLAICNYKLLDETSGEFSDPADHGRWGDLKQSFYRLDEPEKKRFLRFIAVPWRKLYKRDMIEAHKLRFPVGDYFYEDNPFHWFTIISAGSVAVVPEVLCYHRVARVGQTMATIDERLFKIFIHHDTIRDWLINRDQEEIYRANLFAWAMSQMEWISAKTPKRLRKKLFDVLLRVYSQYDAQDINDALLAGQKGKRAAALSSALERKNRSEFNRILDGKKAKKEAVSKFILSRLSSVSPLVKSVFNPRLPSIRRNGILENPHEVRNDDLMFSIVVLQEQLNRIEAKLEELKSSESK